MNFTGRVVTLDDAVNYSSDADELRQVVQTGGGGVKPPTSGGR